MMETHVKFINRNIFLQTIKIYQIKNRTWKYVMALKNIPSYFNIKFSLTSDLHPIYLFRLIDDDL